MKRIEAKDGKHFCSGCKKYLNPSKFGKNLTRWNGLKTQCFLCTKANHTKWRRSKGIKTKEEYLSSIRKFDEFGKFCPACKTKKPLHDFDKASGRPSSYQTECRECHKIRAKAYYEAIKSDPEKLEKRRAYYRKKEKKRRKERKNDPAWIKMRAAHTVINGMVTGGWMTPKPCEICGKEKTEAHHDDYDKPLEVRWLCRSHHAITHKS